MDNVMDDIIENDIENDIEIAPQPSTSGQIVQIRTKRVRKINKVIPCPARQTCLAENSEIQSLFSTIQKMIIMQSKTDICLYIFCFVYKNFFYYTLFTFYF